MKKILLIIAIGIVLIISIAGAERAFAYDPQLNWDVGSMGLGGAFGPQLEDLTVDLDLLQFSLEDRDSGLGVSLSPFALSYSLVGEEEDDDVVEDRNENGTKGYIISPFSGSHELTVTFLNLAVYYDLFRYRRMVGLRPYLGAHVLGAPHLTSYKVEAGLEFMLYQTESELANLRPALLTARAGGRIQNGHPVIFAELKANLGLLYFAFF